MRTLQVQRVSIIGPAKQPEVQVIEALALPEGDPVYNVSIRGWGSQKEVQEVRVGAVHAANETAIEVRSPDILLHFKRSIRLLVPRNTRAVRDERKTEVAIFAAVRCGRRMSRR